jgi:type IV pilus assembly protein PilA
LTTAQQYVILNTDKNKFQNMTTAKLLKLKNSQKGFTLIELLVVIGILAILLAIVLIAINPARQFAQANNTKRTSDVNAILNAIGQYAADNRGALPTGMPTAGDKPIYISDSAGEANICSSLVTKYLAALPKDPSMGDGSNITSCSGYNSGYFVSVSATDNRVTVYSTYQSPATASISATR